MSRTHPTTRAVGVVDDRGEELGLVVHVGVVLAEPGHVLAERAEQDRLAQVTELRVERVAGCDRAVVDHGDPRCGVSGMGFGSPRVLRTGGVSDIGTG